MLAKRYSYERIETIQKHIFRLKDIDFPYQDSKDALVRVEEIFEDLKENINNAVLSTDSSVPNSTYTRVLEEVSRFLPVLGFILRSTNVRNAFEVHGPLKRVAEKLLGEGVRLLLSSEWEYSPYTYKPIPLMDGFVLIGLPATESSNPLLLPLAGHELGHSYWSKNYLDTALTDLITRSVIELIKEEETWSKFKKLFPADNSDPDKFDIRSTAAAVTWAIQQSQEMFCDLVGLTIFGASYLHAFVYLTAPGHEGRPPHYPSTAARLRHLTNEARVQGYEIREGYEDEVVDRPMPSHWGEKEKFLVALADSALEHNIPQITKLVKEEIISKQVGLPTQKYSDMIEESFARWVVPFEGKCELSDILNAGWELFLDDSRWRNEGNIQDKAECLPELLLKSIEILEVEHRRPQKT